ncbi:MAG: FtsX-like permease family protein [Clostridiales bacterium]|nr:FtsX-like permease family protein [Clostridiales bacterium]
MSLRNLKRKGARTLLTLLSIAIGVCSVLIISVISDAGKAAVNHELDSLGVNGIAVSVKQSDGSTGLKNEDLSKLRGLEDVAEATPVLTKMGVASAGGQSSSTMIWGIDSGANQVISLEMDYGRTITAADVAGRSNVCLVDATTADALYHRTNAVGGTLYLSLGGGSEPFEIIGVAAPDSGILQSIAGEYIPAFVYIPYTTLQRYIGSDALSQIAIQVPEEQGDNLDAVARKIERSLRLEKSADATVHADNLVKQRGKLSNTLDIVTLVLTVIGSISLVVAGLGIMTVMLVSVTERTREIGIKKAIGARRGAILREFLTEAMLLSVLGSGIGLAAGAALTEIASAVLQYPIHVSVYQAAGALAIALCSGVLFGVYPAIAASKMRPVDALRRD